MPADTPDNGAGYVRSYPGRRGTHHEHAWVSWSGGGDVWTRTIDEDGWAAWRWSLVERGLLPPIDAAGLEAMREKLQAAWNRPVRWPLLLLAVVLLAVIIPAVIGHRRRQRQPAYGRRA